MTERLADETQLSPATLPSPDGLIGVVGRRDDVARVRRLVPTAAKLLLSLCVLATTAMNIVGDGAWAAFNATAAESHSVGSGVVTLALGSPGTAANRLSIGATNMVPTDKVERAVDITNTGTIAWSRLGLTTTAAPSSALDTNGTDGLQMTVDECSLAWTETGPPYVYTCAGTTTVRVASRPVIASDVAVDGAALSVGSTGHYRVTLQLPSTAPTSMQGLSSTVNYSFTAAQRTGTNV